MIEERFNINMKYDTIKNMTVYTEHDEVPKDYRAVKIYAIFLVIFAVVGVYFLLWFNSIDYVTGNVLTTEYVKDYCRKDQCGMQMFANFMAAVVMLFCIIYELIVQVSNKRRDRGSFVPRVALIVGICLIFTCLGISKTLKSFESEPVITTAQISEKYTKTSHSRHGHTTRYFLKFSGGTKYAVTYTEYNEANIGDTYYIAYFGGTAVKIFDADEYSLPE